ncbi:MAG: HDOD domain-containing protein [Planctomycetes bacterium]|nr:HDOD domain-containing protein [Planctomycetota bacterium]
MKTPGERAMELPWLAPSLGSLTALAQSHGPSVWTHLRGDPGMLLLSARALDSSVPVDVTLLEATLQHQSQFPIGFVDWNQPGVDALMRTCWSQAVLASQLCEKVGGDGRRAWIAGFLAPLGWLALAAVTPDRVGDDLLRSNKTSDGSVWQRELWGCDHTGLARRLCRNWRLPAWLSAIVGYLGMPIALAERLGADGRLLAAVQLSVRLCQDRVGGPGLTVGTSSADLLHELELSAAAAGSMADAAVAVPMPTRTWEPLGQHALLPDLLRLALENRRQSDAAWIERLQNDIDLLQDALAHQNADEGNRLNVLKLSALAEFAAGAGHEINNPLAVISGQAQYVLKQMEWLDVPAEEIEDIGEYLDNLRGKITPSLQKIIGQTQRVHQILTDLMQFARPHPPHVQPISARKLIRDVADGLELFAQQRKVQLMVSGPEPDEMLSADPKQSVVALAALLRNAIEAAPSEGWARIRAELTANRSLGVIVEDNGAGPSATACEHLFDPFYSGRTAGRGRGLGLPIAWRLARLQGGDLRFDGAVEGATRFVLTLPLAGLPAIPVAGNGYHIETELARSA